MNFFKKILLISILLVILIYVTNITSIPDRIILFDGEELNIQTLYGLNINKNENNSSKIIRTSSNLINNNTYKEETASLSLFGTFNLKNIEVDTIPRTEIVPLGNTVGLKLYTSGVLVVGLTEIDGKKPYENSGIEEGILITFINQTEVTTTEELKECVNNSKGKEIEITYLKDGEELKTKLKPVKTSNNEYKLGLWVRDGASGVGTVTYYEPDTKKFAALGHGILDVDTEELITIADGNLVTTNITEIVKGEKGNPGEIKGTILNGIELGTISDNSNFGIYGTLNNISPLNINKENTIEVASRDEIGLGKAEIILAIEDGTRKNYEIEITKIYKNNNTDNKSMLIKITDPKLLELTGGIIQRNEWSTNSAKWKIYRSSNTCTNIRSNIRLCGIWRFNGKTNEGK